MRMPSVSGFGLFPLPTGSHFSKVLMDDAENESNVNTEDLVTQLVTRIGALMPTLQAGAQYLQMGTVYHEKGPNTAYQSMWPTYRVPILDKHGNPTFPSRFPMARILSRQKEINDPYIWAGQYLLKHHPRTAKFFYPFRGDLIKTYNYV